ncbi:MAG: HAMP domain-containing histidine kinase [Acidobacteriota bacterium]|nr:HAMP domain-containing histidine kinase [Acidobacteriota bacterium]
MHATLIWQIRSLWTEPFFVDYQPWVAVVVLVILISIACWLPLIRGLTRTISRLTQATGQIADGHFEITLHLTRRDELGRLSESINRMAHRLSGLVDGQKRFLSDIAHELSSPLARMQIGLGILEQRSTEADLEYVADVREEVEHMSGLVNELLAFSKSRIGEKRLQLVPVVIAEVLDRVLARERSGSTILEVSIDRSITALAQPELLFRAVANVVRNAIRYAGPAGPICISAVRSKGDVCLSVADNGPGLPESELENVFRAFYRPDFARQRETGGTGLGLAIVRDCVESCGGTVRCRNRDPNGLEVVIRLRATVQ